MPDVPDQRLAIVCGGCGYPSAARVFGKIEGEDEDGLFELSLVQCEFCDSVRLVRQDEAREATPMDLWPITPRTLDEGIPQAIRDAVTEARKCFGAGAYGATAVMVRGTIEGFCAHHGASNRVLHRSLAELVQRGVIDQRLLEWADGLRVLGNVGAHFNDRKVTRQDASDALDLVEAVLDYVYVFSAKFEQFKARRDA